MLKSPMMKLLSILALLVSLPVNSQERITHPDLAKKRCLEKSHYRSCYELAHLFHNTKYNEAESLHYAQKGCELELKESCSKDKAFKRMHFIMKKKKQWDKSVSEAVLKTPSLIKVPTHIRQKEKNCLSKKNVKDCSIVGTHFQYLQSPADIKRAIKVYRIGCKHGQPSSCSALKLIKKGIGKVYEVDM